MVETVTLALPQPTEQQAYQIIIGSGILGELASYIDLKAYSKVHVLYDANVKASFDQMTASPNKEILINSEREKKLGGMIERAQMMLLLLSDSDEMWS